MDLDVQIVAPQAPSFLVLFCLDMVANARHGDELVRPTLVANIPVIAVDKSGLDDPMPPEIIQKPVQNLPGFCCRDLTSMHVVLGVLPYHCLPLNKGSAV